MVERRQGATARYRGKREQMIAKLTDEKKRMKNSGEKARSKSK